jgi:hypothetical protein
MSGVEGLRQIVEELIGALHQQARELERLVERVEQVAGHLGNAPEFGVIGSELAALHVRVKKLAAPGSG